jgi:hypothetical protein
MNTTPEDSQATPEGTGKMRKADCLREFIHTRAYVYPTPEGQVYARIRVRKHIENIPLRSNAFRAWVTHQHVLETGRTVGKDSISDAIEALEGEALYGGAPTEEIHLRVAEHAGRIYLFLGDQDHTVIQIDGQDWRVCPEPPVNFVKSRGMLPLPMPERSGTLDLFKKYVNVADDQLVLYMAWLIATLRPSGPYPVLNISGEQGSAKSTATRLAKALVDPTKSAARVEPRAAMDMMIAANNEHVLAWDNLSGLKVSAQSGRVAVRRSPRRSRG